MAKMDGELGIRFAIFFFFLVVTREGRFILRIRWLISKLSFYLNKFYYTQSLKFTGRKKQKTPFSLVSERHITLLLQKVVILLKKIILARDFC